MAQERRDVVITGDAEAWAQQRELDLHHPRCETLPRTATSRTAAVMYVTEANWICHSKNSEALSADQRKSTARAARSAQGSRPGEALQRHQH
jgi:hypothetical protein